MTDEHTTERLARRIETRQGYKSAIQIAVEELPPNLVRRAVILGQGDYPSLEQIADRVTKDGNLAADMIRQLAASRDELLEALELCANELEYRCEEARGEGPLVLSDEVLKTARAAIAKARGQRDG